MKIFFKSIPLIFVVVKYEISFISITKNEHKTAPHRYVSPESLFIKTYSLKVLILKII